MANVDQPDGTECAQLALLRAMLSTWKEQYQALMDTHDAGACPTVAGIIAKLEQTMLTTRQYLARVRHEAREEPHES